MEWERGLRARIVERRAEIGVALLLVGVDCEVLLVVEGERGGGGGGEKSGIRMSGESRIRCVDGESRGRRAERRADGDVGAESRGRILRGRDVGDKPWRRRMGAY